jgi:mRNA-degrading endonuclease HigB of HigAB toxin-antitoxin module
MIEYPKKQFINEKTQTTIAYPAQVKYVVPGDAFKNLDIKQFTEKIANEVRVILKNHPVSSFKSCFLKKI